MYLEVLCRSVGILCPEEVKTVEIQGISTDSRTVRAGDMFVCIRGLHSDGHTYIREAVQKGAACILTDRYDFGWETGNSVFLRCGDTRRAAAYLYDAWYGHPSKKLKIIGVTGTNGKTSVTHMIKGILETAMLRCGIIGTVGCSITGGTALLAKGANPLANMTTPDPEELYFLLSEMVKAGVEYVVMEVSSHALALGKVAPIEFAAAIFTNLTPEHLDFHKTMEAYAKAKELLFEQAKLSVINIDSPYGKRMAEAARGKSILCTAEDRDGDYCAEEISYRGSNGVDFRLRSLCTRLRLACPIPGSFTVMNAMQAAICALELGISPAVIKIALSSSVSVRGRMERVKLGLDAEFSVFIDYAHTPDAMEKLLRTSRELLKPKGQLVILFGCGGDRDRTKRAVMGEIASRLADRVILTSDNCRGEDPLKIIAEIEAGIAPDVSFKVIPDREAAIRYAIMNARRGDLILLAGKGHEEYEIRGNERFPFCEREIARAAFCDRRRMENDEKDAGMEPNV
ncbi:MAG: UDP-N-acetylmuramoyl-L-alanyl-D-glutamate--2,6-diaminopimelate ligase [Clostridia bacterium]|nr:UDP-N-acetylmuramoyl-L-alanyl-D-glutamate--2,6-diaminopimelate ligase [Clostridia bacterium]